MTPLPQTRRFAFALSLWAVLSAALLIARHLNSQQIKPSSDSIQTTTEERVASEAWWPTKSSFPLSAYAGSDSCTKCHAEEASGPKSAMQRAASPVADSPFLASNPKHTVTVSPFTYALAGSDLNVTAGSRTLTNRIAWDLGAGDLAHTFLYQHEGHWFQSQVTYYTHIHALDTTTGFNTVGEPDVETALGQKLTNQEARKCFGCHTVHPTSSAGFDPARAEPGLGCEACHGPGRRHVEQMTADPHAKPAATEENTAFRRAIFNPAALSPTDAIDFCGSCHRTSMDATLAAGPHSLGKAAVRFQPYRLEQSKCWRATQSERLTCTGCHDPHQQLDPSPVKYDKTCIGCHTVIHGAPMASHISAVATGGQTSCVSCHMPRVEVSSMHGQFTDHRIRVPHPGEAFPD